MKKVSLVLFLLTLAQHAYAQTAGAPLPGSGRVTSPINSTSIAEFANRILGIVIQVGIPVAVIMIVYTGFLFVTAGGNTEKLDQAKKLKELEKENSRLKKLVADLSLDNSILKEAAQGNF